LRKCVANREPELHLYVFLAFYVSKASVQDGTSPFNPAKNIQQGDMEKRCFVSRYLYVQITFLIISAGVQRTARTVLRE
jgi:hypothetical protein